MSALNTFTETTSPTLVADEDVLFEAPAPETATNTANATYADPQGRTTALPKLALADNKPRLLVTRERRYNVLKRLGAGGVGEVFLAVDQDIGRKIAIKKVASAATSRGALVRFIYEVQTIGRLEHPNIVPIHDVGQDENGDYYFVMKYVEGETLEQIIEKLRNGDEDAHRRYGVEQRVGLVRSVMEALAFAHARGIVHRDIKPANVMVGGFGEVLLLDWGIAQSTDPSDLLGGPRDGVLIGTPLYMSPEQAAKKAVDARSDVYSLSVMLHELLTLQHYLDGVTALDALLDAVQTREIGLATLTRHRAQSAIPMDLTWFVHQGVQKDPAARFQSMQEMIDRLDRRAAGEIDVVCPVTLTKRMATESVKASDRFVVPLLGPILRAWAWALGRFGVRAMFAAALALFVSVLLAIVAMLAGGAGIAVLLGAVASAVIVTGL
jgi:eukaryotic-like serine/threonine-protein kinase